MLIELGGLLYGFAEDLVGKIVDYVRWDEEDKLVEMAWLDKSGFKLRIEEDGYKWTWSRPDRIETRKLEGYEIIYEVDRVKRIRRRIVLRDGLTLV